MTDLFRILFLIAIVLSYGLKVWLARRHIRHVSAHRAAVPAAFCAEVPLDAHQRAADYTVAKTRLAVFSASVDTLLLLGFTLWGGLDVLIHFWATLLSPYPLWQGVALLLSYVAISGLVGLPLMLYSTFGLEARFGFNTMTLGLFVVDQIKSLCLGLLLGVPLLLLVLWLMEAAGALWWFDVWAVWCTFSLLLLMIYPNLIAPLFNRFQPLADVALVERITALLTRCGFRSSGVFVMDGSRRSAHGNAYFTGFGAGKRIVFLIPC